MITLAWSKCIHQHYNRSKIGDKQYRQTVRRSKQFYNRGKLLWCEANSVKDNHAYNEENKNHRTLSEIRLIRKFWIVFNVNIRITWHSITCLFLIRKTLDVWRLHVTPVSGAFIRTIDTRFMWCLRVLFQPITSQFYLVQHPWDRSNYSLYCPHKMICWSSYQLVIWGSSLYKDDVVTAYEFQ